MRLPWRPGAIEDQEGVSEGDSPGKPQPKPAEPVRLTLNRAPAAEPLTPGQEVQVQQGLSGRLELLFQRFLVGKVVGADLVLPAGQVLAVRGTAITRELVQQCEETGLLPSLITHMTISGLAK